MGKAKALTVTLHIGGKQVETLTEEQKERMSQRLSDVMSLYYTNHPEEYLNLKEPKKTESEETHGKSK